MKKIYKYLLALLGIGIIVFLITWQVVFKKSDSSVKNSKAEYEIEATQILNQFETNEELANTQYLGKVIIVSGTLESFKETPNDISLYIKQETDMSGILCSFDKTAIDLSVLKTGSPIKVKGICTGYLIDVVMNKCALVE